MTTVTKIEALVAKKGKCNKSSNNNTNKKK